MRCYSDLIKRKTYFDRLEYLKTGSRIGEFTFGYDRWLNQRFYTSKEWNDFRRSIIIRDNGCDLGIDGLVIEHDLLIHHINPISKEDLMEHNLSKLIDPENAITTCLNTHNRIHYGGEEYKYVERTPGDTTIWKKVKQ